MQTQIRRWPPIWTLFSTNCKVTVWKMKELKPYLQQSLTTSCPLKFLLRTNAGNTDKSTRQQQFPILNAELSRMKRSVELLSRETTRIDFQAASSCVGSWHKLMFQWFSQQPTLTFLHPCFAMFKLKYSMQDRQKPFSEFQQTAAVETFDKLRYKSFLKVCLYSTWFMFIEFVFKLVVACSFLVARVIKNRKPFEFKWPEVRFNRKQTSISRVCHIINYLLT